MNEIAKLLNKVMASNEEYGIEQGKHFALEYQFEKTSGVQPNDDFINLLFNNFKIASYDSNEQELEVLDWDFKTEIKFFADCLESEGWAVYVPEKL